MLRKETAFNKFTREKTMYTKLAILALALASAAATASVASAGAISGLCDTGLSATSCGTPLGPSLADPNWTVIVGRGSASLLVPFAADTTGNNPGSGGYYICCSNLLGTATASWITVTTNGLPSGTLETAFGTYIYQETIMANVTGSVTFTGGYDADNCATIAWSSTANNTAPTPVTGPGVTLGNGVGANCASSSSTFSVAPSTHPFSFTENVVATDTYYLDIEVGNTGSVTGLLVDNLAATAAVPEPSSVLLMLTGLATLLGGVIPRRKSKLLSPKV
jgi:hypothetical protein